MIDGAEMKKKKLLEENKEKNMMHLLQWSNRCRAFKVMEKVTQKDNIFLQEVLVQPGGQFMKCSLNCGLPVSD